jgi:hypothetical protein
MGGSVWSGICNKAHEIILNSGNSIALPEYDKYFDKNSHNTNEG